MTQARPSRIGKYEVESVVGEGAMGVVYCAVDSMLNRRVAIKVMSDAIAQDANLRERFLREAQAAGSLQHPNVVTVYDFGEVDGHLYIAMEYVEGDDLEDLLGSRIPLPLEAKLGLVIGVLQGLAFAHKRGVIHRDIKPANIRVDQDGKARIMDFGVAHLASSDMTRTGTMLGTPSYMAPEQIVGGPVSAETDIFSVGAVLYELLTNVRPFKGDTLQTLMYQILSTMPVPIGQLVPELPAELDRIVMRALQKEPKDRYARALDMANDLSMVRTAKEHDGTSTSLSLRATIDTALADRYAGVRRTARRRTLTAVATGVLGGALLLGIGYQLWQWNSPPRPSETSPPLVSTSTGSLPESPAGTSGAPPAPDSTVAAPPVSVAVAPRDDQRPAAPTRTTQTLSTSSKPVGPTAREIALARNAQRSAPESATARTAVASAGDPAVGGVPVAPPAPRPVDPPVTLPLVQAGSPPGAVTPPPVPTAPPRATTNPAPEINSIIASYARAIESRDIAELRRAYPGMTSDQRRAFEDFFRSTRSLRAALSVSDLQVDGETAEARLSGSYEYVTTAGDTERRLVSFRATLQHDSNVWKLMAVR